MNNTTHIFFYTEEDYGDTEHAGTRLISNATIAMVGRETEHYGQQRQVECINSLTQKNKFLA